MTLRPPLALVASLAVAAAAHAGEGPRLALEERDLRLDELVQGEVVEVELPVANAGDAPLRIARVDTTCGCSVARAPTEPIAPGEAAVIALRYDSAGLSGTQGFEVHVYSNDPTQRDRGPYCAVVRVEVDVRDHYRVVPRGVYLGELVRGGEPAERTVRITGRGPARDGFAARVASELPDWLEAEVTGPIEGGVALEVRVLPHVPAGDLLHEVVVETDVEEQPRLRVPVSGVVTEPVHAPTYLLLRAVSARAGSEPARIVLERRDGRDGLPLVALEHDPDVLAVTSERVTPRRVELTVRAEPGLPAGPLAAEVVVRLDLPAQPIVRIPVVGWVEPAVAPDPPLVLLEDGRGATVLRGVEVRSVRVEPAGAAEATVGEAPAGGVRIAVEGAGPATLVVETSAGAVRVPVRPR